MGKKDVAKDNEAVEHPDRAVQEVQEAAGNTNTAQTTPSELKSGEEKLPIQPKQGAGEGTDDKGNTGLDTESQKKATGKDGNKVDNQVEQNESEEITAKRSRIAKDVFEKNVQCKELHFTSDLIPFFVKSDANRHADTLKNKDVVTVKKQ